MSKNKLFLFCELTIGIILAVVSFAFRKDMPVIIAGILIAAGIGLIGNSISQLMMDHFEKKNPEIIREDIAFTADERNDLIRYKAKAKTNDITQWLIIGMALISVLTKAPVWAIILFALVYLAHLLMPYYFMVRYRNEMKNNSPES